MTATVRPSLKETALWAVAGRLAFVMALGGLVYAAFFPMPRLFASVHVAHFAGFYILGVAAAAAAKQINLIPLGCYVAAFAVALELARSVIWLPLSSSYLDWIGDMAGIVAALAPMLLQKIRAEFYASRAA